MSVLSKEERKNWRSVDALGVTMMPEDVVGFILRALDTIDALEAERVDLRKEVTDLVVESGVLVKKTVKLKSQVEHMKARQGPMFVSIDSYAEQAALGELKEIRADYRELLLIINQDKPGIDITDELRRCVSHQQSIEGDPLTVRLEKIRAYAAEHSTTKVIGGAHAALRRIAEMAGGGE